MNPATVVGNAPFDALERMGVPPTSMTVEPHTGQPFRDRRV